MKIQANQLSSHLQKTLAPCYLVSGDEHLLVTEALDAIRGAARGRGFTARDVHVATSGFDWSALRASGSNLSLFAERRIVELRLPTGKPGRVGSQEIVELADRCGDDLMFLVSCPKLDRGSLSASWAKALQDTGVGIQVWPVETRDLPAWITARMRSAGLKPDRQAVALVADRVEGNLLAAAQEIEKLRLLLGEGRVSADDISQAVGDSSRYDVFKLVDAALAGEPRRVVKILAGLRGEGVEPVAVVWAMTRELRTLARLGDAIAAGADPAASMQKHGVWPARQALVRRCLGRHRPSEFRDMLKSAGQADLAAKGRHTVDPWQFACDILLGLALGERKAA